MQFRTIKSAIAAVTFLGAVSAQHAVAAITWNWSYAGDNIAASGTLLTSDTADASGFYQITAISGSRNGDAITGLYPTGQAIPGNDGFPIDNLIRIGTNAQITSHGFGFATASGNYANPYFADFKSPPVYTEVFTTSSSFSELPITFSASPVPEPELYAMLIAGLGLGGIVTFVRRRPPQS